MIDTDALSKWNVKSDARKENICLKVCANFSKAMLMAKMKLESIPEPYQSKVIEILTKQFTPKYDTE